MSSVLPASSSPRLDGHAPSSRSKRDDILTTAIEYFGQHGYEYTKWADIAKAVGVGSTALYHYFESKLHCLYEIQALAVQADRAKFERVDRRARGLRGGAEGRAQRRLRADRSRGPAQPRAGGRAVARRPAPHVGARGGGASSSRRSQMRDLEFAWATFLTRGMEQGAIPQADPRLLARAILGLYTSVWHWYRPRRQPVARGGPRVLRRPLPRGRRPAARRAAAKAEGHRQAQRGEAQAAQRSKSTAVERPTT